MYMMRKIDNFLNEWKEDPYRKPLIVKGPRQVGKTESIRKFASENYESIIEINFVEEPKYEMIISDGYKTDYTMHSMDFEEFLWAKGYDNSFIDNLLEHMKKIKAFNELELNLGHSLFLDYCILGGMPAVVREYIAKNTFEGSLETQRQLIEDYKEDIRKYAVGLDQTRIMNVFNHIAPQLAKKNKKFQISKVASGARFKDYRSCIE